MFVIPHFVYTELVTFPTSPFSPGDCSLRDCLSGPPRWAESCLLSPCTSSYLVLWILPLKYIHSCVLHIIPYPRSRFDSLWAILHSAVTLPSSLRNMTGIDTPPPPPPPHTLQCLLTTLKMRFQILKMTCILSLLLLSPTSSHTTFLSWIVSPPSPYWLYLYSLKRP